jgi:hypothetical protein
MIFSVKHTLLRFVPAALLAAAFTFSCGSVASALSVTVVTADNGLPARAVQWTDATGQARTAIMVDQRAEGAGYLRRLTYQVDGGSRICTGTGADGHQGDGYVQNHTANGGDSSSHSTPGATTVVLAGTHHAIISYDMPSYQLDGHTVPTTVQWFFADGRSHPIYALSQDARATAGNLGADSRSPYGDVAYDGGVGATVGGASFGDTYKFATLAAAPEQVTRASGWRYNEANTIPYAMQWADPAQADAEMGHVATLPIGVKDQGSDPRTFPVVDVRNTQQLNGPMIDDENWAYQILNYVLPANGPTWSKRLTWGTNWGLPGGFDNYSALDVRQYSQHATSTLGQAYDGTRADGMLLAYSVFVVLGTHSGGYKVGSVGQTVTQMENSALATLAAVTGTVKTSGPAGVGNAAAATVTYTPAGYNGVVSTWELVAAGNTIDATLTPAAGKSLDHPIFVVNGYTIGQLPATISVGNGLATPGVDYFATLDTAHQRLWITVNRSASSAVNLKVGTSVDTPLSNGVALNQTMTAPAQKGTTKYYYIDLPAGSSNLAVDLYNLTGDLDLYVRQGSKPTLSIYDCKSAVGGSTSDTCTFSSPASDRWWIGVTNFDTGTFSYTIKASWNTGYTGCSGGVVVLQNMTFTTGNTYDCTATISITADTGVTVQSGATVNFRAPIINLQPGFRIESGAVFSAKQ